MSVIYANVPSEMVNHYQSILRIRRWKQCKALALEVDKFYEKIKSAFEKNSSIA